jgi:myosin heavy subunit
MTCPETWPGKRGESNFKGETEKILKMHNIPNTEYRFGKTKVFIRNPSTVRCLLLQNFETKVL